MQARNLDWEKIYEATAMIPGFGDYTSLCRPSEDFKTNLCDVTEARWDKVIRPAGAGDRNYEFMRLTITSNRFLRGMIRKIVGVLILIGRNKLSIADYKRIVEAKEEFPFGVSSPPQGLYLTKVRYKEGILEGKTIDRTYVPKPELEESDEEE
jgi:tRNA pseudouridine38-40 synthase